MRSLILTLLATIIFHTGFTQSSKEKLTTVLAEMRSFDKEEDKIDSATGFVLGRFSEADFKRRYDFDKKIYAELLSIQQDSLNTNDQVDVQLLLFQQLESLHKYEYKEYLNPILSDAGFHSYLPGNASRPVTSKKEIENYLNILKAIPAYVDQHLALMRTGLSLGISQPKIALTGYEATYDTHIVDAKEKSLFWKPFAKKPEHITEAEWNNYLNEATTAVTGVINSYKKIKTFFEQEYYPKTRTTLGASNFPNGKKFYADKVKYYTTLNTTPDEIYTIGMNEVQRIQKEMEQVIADVKFKGTFKEFITYLRTDPKFFPSTGEQLLKEASFIAKKIDGMLPLLFGKLPRQPYGVEPVPAYLAPSYTTGRYSGAPINSRSAGHYWVNTYDLKSRTLYTLEALTLHEAVPGHHLQTSLAQELTGLSEFRRNMYVNAFGEGWGLYSEYLGYELGLYKDPYSLFGRLTYEMWRACRLVIDVGIHDRNWTREQAVSFLADHTALSLHEVNTEVNRYISWPGQALAYKMGEITIKRLRKKAEDTLKEKFDVREFHDLVLSQGSVTMAILEKMVDRYIENKMK
jgi:uncharacterized protein (DUF885 family)